MTGLCAEEINQSQVDHIIEVLLINSFESIRGLGLAVALGTIKTFGGCVAVKSKPGKGSVFQVFWPLASENQK